MYQPNLFLTKELSKNYIDKFHLLFSLINFPAEPLKLKRRPPHPKYALLNALIYKNPRSILTLSELAHMKSKIVHILHKYVGLTHYLP